MGPARVPDGHLLWRFRLGGPTPREQAQQAMHELLVDQEVSTAIKDYLRATTDAPPEPPPVIEYPIDEALQSGESRQLGGAMEIKSPWSEP
jgi:hypothetical protein